MQTGIESIIHMFKDAAHFNTVLIPKQVILVSLLSFLKGVESVIMNSYDLPAKHSNENRNSLTPDLNSM